MIEYVLKYNYLIVHYEILFLHLNMKLVFEVFKFYKRFFIVYYYYYHYLI